MKRGTQLLVLLAALAVAVGAYFAVTAAVKDGEGKKAEEAAQTNEQPLAAGGYDEIDAMAWTYGGVSVSLERDGDGQWYCPDEPDCPIDQSKAAIMQSAASAVAGELYVEKAEELASYGLDEPQLELTVRAGEVERRYAVGDYSELAGRYYMTVDGGSDVYLEGGELTASFWYDLENLVQFESAPADVSQLTSMTVETDVQSYTLEYEADPLTVSYTDAFHWFAAADGAYSALDADKAEALCNKAAQITFKVCETWKADAAALAALPEPIAARAVRQLAGRPVSAGHIAAVLHIAKAGGAADIPGMRVVRAGGKLVFGAAEGGVLPDRRVAEGTTPLPEAGLLLRCGRGTAEAVCRPFTTFCFSSDKICGKISVTARRAGDRLRPAGRGCTKTLKQLFLEGGVEPGRRDAWPVLRDENGILIPLPEKLK